MSLSQINFKKKTYLELPELRMYYQLIGPKELELAQEDFLSQTLLPGPLRLSGLGEPQKHPGHCCHIWTSGYSPWT